MANPVLLWRWIVAALAVGFFLYQFTTTNLSAFGWQFRFLTIWGLTANMIVAVLMLRLSMGRSSRDHNAFVSAAAVMGAVVVLMYWKLYFTDPKLVNSAGPIPWYQEYYLHALGPLLMWIDAFFVLGVFRRILPTLGWMMGLFVGYIVWIEVVIHPMNETPVGKVTSGLPYPFLNNMEMGQRLEFYFTTIVTALVIGAIFWGLAAILRRVMPA